MKIFVSILFSIFYLTSTSGVTVNAHYCGGKIKHITFVKSSDTNCCSKKKMSKNCCKDKSAYFKVNDNHQSSDLLKAPAPSFKISDLISSGFEFKLAIINRNKIVLYSQVPPVLFDNQLYLKHRVLLI